MYIYNRKSRVTCEDGFLTAMKNYESGVFLYTKYIKAKLKNNRKKHFISIIPEVGEVKLTTLENRNSKLHSKIDIPTYSCHKPLVKY